MHRYKAQLQQSYLAAEAEPLSGNCGELPRLLLVASATHAADTDAFGIYLSPIRRYRQSSIGKWSGQSMRYSFLGAISELG